MSYSTISVGYDILPIAQLPGQSKFSTVSALNFIRPEGLSHPYSSTPFSNTFVYASNNDGIAITFAQPQFNLNTQRPALN